jgi:hypothetical protein
MSTPIQTLNLGSRLERRLDPVTTIEGLLSLNTLSLSTNWKLSAVDIRAIDAALTAAGRPGLTHVERRPPKPPKDRSCRVPMNEDGSEVCTYTRMHGKQQCTWHWLAKQPIGIQIAAADQRRSAHVTAPGFVERSRVAPAEWPQGERWCSECQGFVPTFYTSGSKCYAHGNRAAHASMVARVYDLSPAEYDRLLEWQGGRCYICGQYPRVRRLAVDHDHESGAVRGLLCANDEWGCNMLLRRLLGNLPMAERALLYVQKTPIDRMRAGEAPPVYRAAKPAPKPAAVDPGPVGDDWRPFG